MEPAHVTNSPAFSTVASPAAVAPHAASSGSGATSAPATTYERLAAIGGDASAAAIGGGRRGRGGGVDIGRILMWAGLGAAAALTIPPLAFLGPIGGAVAGAVLSFVL
jgi:hypothetical protein